MGSFAGVNIDAQNLKQAVSLAEQKKILGQQSGLKMLNNDVKIAMPQYNSSNNVLVEKKPYLVVQEFNIKNFYNDWKTGKEVFQELPITKGGVIVFPTGAQQDQYELALQQGKLKELPIVTVESLVDKQSGFCGQLNKSQMMQMVARPPCVSVSKGEILKGYVVSGNFTYFKSSGFQEAKPVLSSNEFKVMESNKNSTIIENSKEKNQNKLIIMVIGAFVLGYLLSND
jgi:hypothetical protein